MSVESSKFTCERDGLTIRGYEFVQKGLKESGIKLPAIIVSHGFTSDHRSTDHYGKYFAKGGYAAFTFDFNGGGPRCKSDGAMTDMTVRTEVADLLAVMTYVRGLPYVDTERLVLMGCSQGGFVSALAAAQLPDQVWRLILFYPAISLADDARMGELMGLKYDPADPPEVTDLRIMKVGREYFLTAQKMHEYEEMLPFAGPVLIVHGTADKVVNAAYSKAAWLAYTTGKVPDAVEREPLPEPDAVPFLPELPTGSVPRASRQLMLIAGAGHGFEMKANANKASMFAVREFMKGYTEVLTVDVRLTGSERVTKGMHTHLELPFGGTARGPWFSGEILDGAKDTQELTFIHADSKCADYVIKGRDYTGAECEVHVINRGSGSSWKPTVTTDSAALSFLNGADCDAFLEQRKCGPLVRIFAKVKK